MESSGSVKLPAIASSSFPRKDLSQVARNLLYCDRFRTTLRYIGSMSPRQKSERISEVFRRQMIAKRQDRRWNQQELAEELDRLGADIGSRSIVSKIENGTRGIGIDDAFHIAAALNCPPPLMFIAPGSEKRVEVTTRSRIHPHLALEWVKGESPLVDSKRYVLDNQGWKENAAPLFMHARLRELQNLAHMSRVRKARGMEREALSHLLRHRELMEEMGYMVPELGEYADRMREFGIEP